MTNGDRIVAFASKALTKEAVAYENIHRETACVLWAVEKFSHFIMCSPHTTTVYTDNRVTSFIRSASSSKLKRWRSILDSHNIRLEHRKGSKMYISDALSRHPVEHSEKYQSDISDEVLEEIVIAKAHGDEGVELLQIHAKNGHCSADRLSKITGASLEKCSGTISRCFDCISRSKVKEYKQVLGTIEDKKMKNHTWCIDFVFGKLGRNETYLSILDRSTRFFMARKMDKRSHDSVIECLRDEFARLGRPKRIVCDREFISDRIQSFLSKENIEFCPLSRESPFLNLLERYHLEIKKIASRSGVSIRDSIEILNNLPFASTPSGAKFKTISPAYLFFENNKEILNSVCHFFEQQSQNRKLRSQELRGKNITRFERKFVVGDIVRFNIGHAIGFGKVVRVNGKIYDVDRIDGSGQTSIHSHQLELVTISELFLKQMLG